MKLQTKTIVQSILLAVGVIVLLSFISNQPTKVSFAQQTSLAEAIKAVVRIRGCNVAGCNVGLGSGVIIHPSGVILTANHVTVTDPRNPLSPRLEDFVIEVTENARQAPRARYRARLLAAKPEADLALLGIYWDEAANQPLDDPATITLPALSIADVNAINLGGRLHILGYPLAGGAAINYTEVALGGFDENGALLKVNASLNEGYSGGPVLVEQDGRYGIAGVVILRRADVSFIRSIDQLNKLIWEPAARRVWADNVQVSVQGSEADATLQISADIHALDYVNRKGRLLAYVFDANTRQPWPAGDGNLGHSANGQMVLYQEFSATRMVDVLQQTTLTISLNRLNTQSAKVVFRLLLWGVEDARLLWLDDRWRYARTESLAVALTASPMTTPASTPTTIVTATDTPQPASVPTPTHTPPTPLPIPDIPLDQVPPMTGVTFVAEPGRLRGSPNTTDSIVITAVENGLTVDVFGITEAGDWLLIQVNGVIGWMFRDLVILNGDPALLPLHHADGTPFIPPTPGPSLKAVSGSIEPISPGNGDSGSGQHTFTWSANFTPSNGYAFELIFWKPGQDPMGQSIGMAAPTTNLSITLNLVRLDEQMGALFDTGEYNWGVLLVRTTPSYERTKYLGGGRRFIYKQEGNSDPGSTRIPKP